MRMGAVLLRMVVTMIRRPALGIATVRKQSPKNTFPRQLIAQMAPSITLTVLRPAEQENQTLDGASPAMEGTWIAMAMG